MRATDFIIEYDVKDKLTGAVVDFYKNKVGEIQKQPVDNYVATAKELLNKTEDSTLKQKLIDIFKRGKDNPYVQGGIITTVGSLLAGGVLSSAQKMGLSPAQTNIMLQAILNTVIPTVVSRINGKSWADTAKYTLASAGIGTGIATLTEIERLHKYDFLGGKDYIKGTTEKFKNIKPLPGGSGFYYHVGKESMYGGIDISILDKSGKEGIGYLSLIKSNSFPILNSYSVHTITVDEDYRNQGIGKALYGIALTILKVTLLAGVSQTPGGRKNWLSLANIPGVDIKGYVVLDDVDIKTDRETDKKLHDNSDIERINRQTAKAEERINLLMGKLGGQYLGKTPGNEVYFTFDVVPGTSELQPAVKTALSKLYYSEYDMNYHTGLYAQWSGQ
jgi:GNAT superfamily N-acetyltransferase